MSARQRILLLGGTGQIGGALRTTLASLGEVDAPDREALDCTRLDEVEAYVAELKPALVVNAVAYTRVDDAERDREAATRLNAELPTTLAHASARAGANLVHYSTDYVFSGDARTPYRESDATGPLSWYGETKLAGEHAVLSNTDRAVVIRTSWVYGHTGRNFLRTILRLARERDELRIVNDQWGSPTWSEHVARGTSAMLAQLGKDADAWRAKHGVWHMSAAGDTTWYEFAERALALDPMRAEHVVQRVTPIATSEYPTAARRPVYSVLDCDALAKGFGISLPDWMQQLEESWRNCST